MHQERKLEFESFKEGRIFRKRKIFVSSKVGIDFYIFA